MKKSTSRLMAITAVSALIFFLIANITATLVEWKIVSGLIQIGLNFSVFMAWQHGYKTSGGLKKLFAFGGIVMPIVMAGITFFRVLLPALLL